MKFGSYLTISSLLCIIGLFVIAKGTEHICREDMSDTKRGYASDRVKETAAGIVFIIFGAALEIVPLFLR